jgi:hypothetical protein
MRSRKSKAFTALPSVLASAFPAAAGAIAILGLALALSGCGEDLKLERRSITYPNGKDIREDWTFVRKPNGDSLEHGVHKKFFRGGSTSEAVVWKMGKRDGSAQAWYENGAVKWQKSYVDGKKDDTWRLSYKDGHPWMVMTYKDDKLTGTVQVWDKTGSPEPKTAEYANGVCTAGDCNLLEAPANSTVPTEAAAAADPTEALDPAAAEALEKARDWEIIKGFLD